MSEIVEIKEMGRHGDGIAYANATKIFVPGALPGEQVEVDGSVPRRNLVKVIESSSKRIAPICEYFGKCGGCQVQHLQYVEYLEWKRELVKAAFGAQEFAIDIEPIVSFKNEKRRRAAFTVSNSHDGMKFGFSEKSSHEIIDIQHCPIVGDEISAKLDDIKKTCRTLFPNKARHRLLVTACNNGLDVQLERPDQVHENAHQSAMHQAIAADFARLSLGSEPIIENRRPMLAMGIANLSPPPGTFLQALAGAENAMVNLVTEFLISCKNTADLFCGVGTFGLRLAENSTVFACENDAAALRALDTAWRGTGGKLKTIRCEKRDLFLRPVMASELKKIQGVVFDPPRSGAQAQAQQLAQSMVKKIAAVSCNPTTLVRDLQILTRGGYKIRRVVPIDQFQYSPHVEVVALLER